MSATKINLLFKLSMLSLAAAMTVSIALMLSPVLSAQEGDEATDTLEVEAVDSPDVDLTEAEEDETEDVDATEAEDEAEAQPSEVTYRYIAKECDSLTKLVRRAILVYDKANEDIELTPEGIIYAETNIVQDMGAYWLDIGQEVIVSGADVEQYALSSLDLTEAQVKAWSKYVPLVDFEIETIQQPEDVEEVVEEIQEELNQDEPEEEPEEETDEDGASAVWWIVGVGSVAVVWYLLWRRDEE